MELTNQAVVNYIGDYDYYLEKKEELTSTYAREALLRRHLLKKKRFPRTSFPGSR
mgnify:CR=1 FL=1